MKTPKNKPAIHKETVTQRKQRHADNNKVVITMIDVLRWLKGYGASKLN